MFQFILAFSIFFVVPFAFGASPGLPFTEDFSDQTLMDSSLTSADWSADEQAAYLKFRSQHEAEPGTYGNAKNFGTGSDSTWSVSFADIDRDGDLDLITVSNGQNALYLRGSYIVSSGQVASLMVNSAETNIARATLTATDDANSPTTRNTDIRYYLSNDGGARWRQVKSGRSFDFDTFGDDIRWKAEITSLSPAISPKITSVVVEENLVSYDNATAMTLRNDFAALDINGD